VETGDERFGTDARRTYRYGDELDPDRDGFDEDDVEEEMEGYAPKPGCLTSKSALFNPRFRIILSS
jgi:hypothetical protein